MKQLSVLLIWIFLTLLLSSFGNWVLGFAAAFLIVPMFQIPLRKSVILGFCTGLLSWLGAAWFLDQANLSQLSDMISTLLQIKSSIIILAIPGILGGLGMALAAWVAAIVFLPANAGKVVS